MTFVKSLYDINGNCAHANVALADLQGTTVFGNLQVNVVDVV